MDKELHYTEKRIKGLSLFFIEEVKKYRAEDGGKRIYAQMYKGLYSELFPKYEPPQRRFPADVLQKLLPRTGHEVTVVDL